MKVVHVIHAGEKSKLIEAQRTWLDMAEDCARKLGMAEGRQLIGWSSGSYRRLTEPELHTVNMKVTVCLKSQMGCRP